MQAKRKPQIINQKNGTEMAWKWLGNGKTAARPAIAALSWVKKKPSEEAVSTEGELILSQLRRFHVVSIHAPARARLPTPRQANKPEPGKNLEQR